jgi:hypothetical protein
MYNPDYQRMRGRRSEFCTINRSNPWRPFTDIPPEPTNGTGSAKRWRPQTPAMAADLTDHVWTLREVLLFRVPPWPQPTGL